LPASSLAFFNSISMPFCVGGGLLKRIPLPASDRVGLLE
jgi:hypothetical protein